MATMVSQLTDECYTPSHITERVHRCLGAIDLDPASCEVANRTVGAARFYTKAEDGFMKPWAGRVFLNPPYTKNQVTRWVKRLGAAYEDGDVASAVLLCNSAPGYDWWEQLWEERPVVVLRRRLTFLQEDGTPYPDHHKKGQTVAYYGRDLRAFVAAFGDLGRVLLPGPYLRELASRLETLRDALCEVKEQAPDKAWAPVSRAASLADMAGWSARKGAGDVAA